MSTGLMEIAYAGDASMPIDSQCFAESAYPFEATVGRLREATAEEDLWVIHEIDPQMLLRRGGYGIPATRQILFFHPRFMSRLLSTYAAAIVEAPLKFVVMERPRAPVAVRYPNPRVQFARYPGLSQLGDDLGELCERMIIKVMPGCEPPLC